MSKRPHGPQDIKMVPNLFTVDDLPFQIENRDNLSRLKEIR